jgi:hypothetical protein
VDPDTSQNQQTELSTGVFTMSVQRGSISNQVNVCLSLWLDGMQCQRHWNDKQYQLI